MGLKKKTFVGHPQNDFEASISLAGHKIYRHIQTKSDEVTGISN
jgi:hypothetical protein